MKQISDFFSFFLKKCVVCYYYERALYDVVMESAIHRHNNASVIEEHHREEYAKLYQICATVVSAPGVIRWSPQFAVGTGGIGLSSKLPLRIHVGIEPRSEGGISFGNIRYYIPERDTFVPLDLSHAYILAPMLLEAAAKHVGRSPHARIHILSEFPWFRGLNMDPTHAVALAAAWLLHLGVVTPADIEAIASLPTVQLASHRAFGELWRLTLGIESSSEAGIADGDLAFGSLIDARYPVAYFREKDPVLFDHYRDLGVEHPASYYNVAGALFGRGVRMEEIVPLDGLPYWPIDIALVHVGEEGSSTAVLKERAATQMRLDGIGAFVRTHCAKLVPETFREVPRFLELADDMPQHPAGMAMYRTYREQSVAHSMAIFHAMCDLLRYGATPQILREFTHTQNGCQYILCLLDLSHRQIGNPRKLLRMTGHKYIDAGIGVRLIGPGKHGCLMVTGPLHSLEPVLADALPKIAEERGKPAHCHYASWCDGTPPMEGVRVHQHLAHGVRSAYVQGAAIAVHVHERGEPASTLLCAPEQWERERAEYDIVVDPREGRIYARGKLLDSSEIHTAKQTIELFRRFFADSTKHEFRPDDLPPSSYRDDRNQMESKVIRPLKTAVERYTKKPLPLRITGGLRKDYTVVFAPTDHRIAWVERL